MLRAKFYLAGTGLVRQYPVGVHPLPSLRGGQLAVRAMVQFLISGDEVSGYLKVVAGEVVVRCYVGASGRGIGCCGVTYPMGELRIGSHALPRGCRRRFVEGASRRAATCVA
jgi:hypothetical protein